MTTGSDCERRRDRYPEEPSNCLSSIAFLPGAAVLAARARRPHCADPTSDRLLALAMAANGIGSAAYHARCTPVSRWLHDWAITSILWLLGTGTMKPRWRHHTEVGGLAAAAAAHAVQPGTAPVVQGLAALSMARTWFGPKQPGQRTVSASSPAVGSALLALAGACYVAGRTGSPWCKPDSRLQFHAGWHVLAAAGVTILALDVDSRRGAHGLAAVGPTARSTPYHNRWPSRCPYRRRRCLGLVLRRGCRCLVLRRCGRRRRHRR
ncbi:hypothetical protein BH18ACT4_BH18ACT4_04760 [soil metagenome]